MATKHPQDLRPIATLVHQTNPFEIVLQYFSQFELHNNKKTIDREQPFTHQLIKRQELMLHLQHLWSIFSIPTRPFPLKYNYQTSFLYNTPIHSFLLYAF
jgi:hypothetical protein